MFRSVQRWSDQSDSTLQDCFDHVDWDMFRIESNNNIDVYADSVSEFISKCIGDVVPTATIKTFPNQKPWIDGSIRAKLKARTTAFNHGKATGNITENANHRFYSWQGDQNHDRIQTVQLFPLQGNQTRKASV